MSVATRGPAGPAAGVCFWLSDLQPREERVGAKYSQGRLDLPIQRVARAEAAVKGRARMRQKLQSAEITARCRVSLRTMS